MKFRTIAASLALAVCLLPSARATPTVAPGAVIASGVVPDEAARAAILSRLREVFGAANIVDRLEVGGVVPPPNWADYMSKLLTDNLKEVHKGQMQVTGTRVALKGTVANEALRQQVVSKIALALNPTYTVDNALVVAGPAAQEVLDRTLSNRIVEFESGSATLTPKGVVILDEMVAAMKQIGMPKVQIIGHTDSSGNRQANVSLSLARANSVRDYLISKGIPAESLTAMGSGPDHPVTSNATAEGRARNRRIEFRQTG
ncbi:OmpA family protein [Azonexus sp.]|uniref:OmpA family protein n=1 Tax=Azonexus sp. TaxID=1872668 RepID=UPI0035AEAA36